MKFVFNVSEWLQNLNIFFMYRQKISCPNAGCQRLCHTSAFKKHLYAPIGLHEYFVKSAPIGAYKCFLNADVWHNLWYPALGQEIFCQYMKNMFKFCSYSETLKTNFIEYVY